MGEGTSRARAHDHGQAPNFGRHRRNLVIVRAGDHSLHPRWLDDDGNRSWDLLVSYFGDDTEKYYRNDIIRIDGKGPKWPALKELIESQSDLIRRYDYVWLPDDDIDCRGQEIDRLFDLCRRHNLLLAQPALTSNSYFSWGVTIRNPFTRMRFTNFVEIMVPCFARDFLMRCVPNMAENFSGWGLDFLWSLLAAREIGRVAIIDSVAVTHTRPVGGANYESLRGRGISAQQERQEFLRMHQITDPIIRIDSLVTKGGFRLSSNSALAALVLRLGYIFLIMRAQLMRYPNRRGLTIKMREAIFAPIEMKS